MSNHRLRNHALSLKAKELLSQMLLLPEDWGYTLRGFAQINKENVDAIREAVRELERAGYIERSCERGSLRGTVYTIYEQPQTEPTPENVHRLCLHWITQHWKSLMSGVTRASRAAIASFCICGLFLASAYRRFATASACCAV